MEQKQKTQIGKLERPIPSPKDVDLIFFHKNCPDGFACATVAFKYFSENSLKIPTFIARDYNDTHHKSVQTIRKKNILVLDMSFEPDDVEYIKQHCNSFLLLDHHRSAQDKLINVHGCVFKQDECGAVMAWKYFYPNTAVPMFIQYIDDRDRWMWKLPQSREISIAMFIEKKQEFEDWLPMLDDNRFTYEKEYLANGGFFYKNYEDRMSSIVGNKGSRTIFLDNKTLFVLSYVSASSIADNALTNKKELDMVVVCEFKDYGKTWSFHLRSRAKEDEEGNIIKEQAITNVIGSTNNDNNNNSENKAPVDVRAIAELFGGGGHVGAASFKCNDFELVRLFLCNPVISEDDIKKFMVANGKRALSSDKITTVATNSNVKKART